MRPGDWQPIETAPKDEEQQILLLFETCSPYGYGDSFVINGWWFSSPKGIDDGWETPLGFIGTPTHWAPVRFPRD